MEKSDKEILRELRSSDFSKSSDNQLAWNFRFNLIDACKNGFDAGFHSAAKVILWAFEYRKWKPTDADITRRYQLEFERLALAGRTAELTSLKNTYDSAILSSIPF